MDDIERASKHEEQNRQIALLQQQQKAASEATNKTGFCMDCEIAIPKERLEILPHCPRCMDCQHVHEIEMKRYV
jgi:phage/conjugal plasmid C-4 type zinc finger TraR family protein